MQPSTYQPLYKIHYPISWFHHDRSAEDAYNAVDQEALRRKSLLFHVEHDDYFATLATILRFYEELVHDERNTDDMHALHLATMRSVIDDLLYLSRGYTIKPKEKIK